MKRIFLILIIIFTPFVLLSSEREKAQDFTLNTNSISLARFRARLL